jgi:hypothetical protein
MIDWIACFLSSEQYISFVQDEKQFKAKTIIYLNKDGVE